MKCPHDQSNLEKVIYEADVEIDRCPKCNGIYLDQGELKKIQEVEDVDYSGKLGGGINREARKFNMERQLDEQKLSCPKCNNKMEKQVHSEDSMIVVDICPSCHGLWLDKGELTALEIYAENQRLAGSSSSKMGSLWQGIKSFFD